MFYLRNAHRISRFVLLWFALFVGTSIASPFINPTSAAPHCLAMEVMKLASGHHESAGDKAAPTLSCPLCAGITAPPSALHIGLDTTPLHGAAPVGNGGSYQPLVALASPPARGPPSTFY